MKEGRISEIGTYKELQHNGEDFSVFLNQYGQEDQEEAIKEEVESVESDEDSLQEDVESEEFDYTEDEKILRRVTNEFQKSKRLTRELSRTRRLSSREEDGAEEAAQLILKEHMETKSVDIEVHKFYFSSVGVWMILLIVTLNIVQQALVQVSDFRLY